MVQLLTSISIYDILNQNKGKKEMILILLLVVLAVVVFAAIVFAAIPDQSLEMRRKQREAEAAKTAKEAEEAIRKQFSYGTDNMGKVISNIDRDSKDGDKVFLDGIPIEKTRPKKKKVGNHYYETVSWVETGGDRIKSIE